MEKNKIRELVDRPLNGKIIGVRLMFRKKLEFTASKQGVVLKITYLFRLLYLIKLLGVRFSFNLI